MAFARTCRCIGTPLRIEPGQCFTCGRSTTHRMQFADVRADTRQGSLRLLAKVHSIQDKMARTRTPAPRGNHRRVVISKPPKSRALETVRGQFSVC